MPALINTSFNLHEEPIVCFSMVQLKSLIRRTIDILIIKLSGITEK